jgi:hypothetical protein
MLRYKQCSAINVKLGIATKITRLSEREELFSWDEHIQDLGYEYHVIDAEFKEQSLAEDELERLANRRNKLVLTIQARREDALELLDRYTSFDTSLCIVAGHPSYLSEKERKLQIRWKLPGIVETSVRSCGGEIWVGVEGVMDIVKPLVEEYGLTSFHLQDLKLEEEIKLVIGRKAVYSRFVFGDEDIDMRYLMRKKSFKKAIEEGEDVSKLIKHFIIYGIRPDFRRRFSELEDMGVEVLVGYPEKLNKEELEGFIGIRSRIS